MQEIRIKEIAIYCQKQIIEKYNSDTEKYQDTLFVSIGVNNEVLCSYTSHVLSGAIQCILIHRYIKVANTNWYDWYDIEFIDKNGCVRPNSISDEYQLKVDYENHFNNQILKLFRENELIFKCKFVAPLKNYDTQIRTVWHLYTRCLECETTDEAVLLGKLAMQDERIMVLEKELANKTYSAILLEKERDQYKELLVTIGNMIKKQE